MSESGSHLGFLGGDCGNGSGSDFEDVCSETLGGLLGTLHVSGDEFGG